MGGGGGGGKTEEKKTCERWRLGTWLGILTELKETLLLPSKKNKYILMGQLYSIDTSCQSRGEKMNEERKRETKPDTSVVEDV